MPSEAETLDLTNLGAESFGKQVSILRELFGFKIKEFAEILGVNEKTIRRWEEVDSDITPQVGHKQAIDALKTIAESLHDLFDADNIPLWINKPNPALDGNRPKDFVKKPGGIFIIANRLGAVGR